MYNKRIIILVIFIGVMLSICVLRLADMQLLSDSYYREQVAQLRVQKGLNQQVRTLRGRILDRNGKEVALDELKFWLGIDYELSRFLDERVRQAIAISASAKKGANEETVEKLCESRLADLDLLINKCVQFGMPRDEVVSRLQKINDRIWNLRVFLAWARNKPGAEILKKYDNNLNNVPLGEAIADFEKKYAEQKDRLKLIAKIEDIAETRKVWPVVELKNDDDVFAARVEFQDVNGIEVIAKGQRVYPYGATAAQIIGWVGQPQKQDKELFADDRLASYLDDELCGREDGVEYVCEPVLRGKRGELVYDIDKELINRTEAQFGKDVRLSIDIELQQKIEKHLQDCSSNSRCKTPIGAVVIDAGSGDILALISLPDFDLNLVRQNYSELAADPCEPLRNRAINKGYPPGSVIKPVILTAGMESGKITSSEAISCPSHKAPQGWPNCSIFRNSGVGHDVLWTNNARNAIKGSCNIYFSHLADRLDETTLQSWLFRFGYGHRLPIEQTGTILDDANDEADRHFRQTQGEISSELPKDTITSFEQLPPLSPSENKWFGIGQGNMRVTPLQAANEIAIIARGGIYKLPHLLNYEESPAEESNDIENTGEANELKKFETKARPAAATVNLGISQVTMGVIWDGMHAVTSESGGTANREFSRAIPFFSAHGIKVYGKTGSTQQPEHAWFGGFAKDNNGKSVALAIVVEGGQQGSADAAPLGRDIIQFCVEAGYIGK